MLRSGRIIGPYFKRGTSNDQSINQSITPLKNGWIPLLLMIFDSGQRPNVCNIAFSGFAPGGQMIPAWFSAVVGGRWCAAGCVQHLSQQELRLMNVWKVFVDSCAVGDAGAEILEFQTPTGIKANKPAGTNGQLMQNEVLPPCLIPNTTFPQLLKYHCPISHGFCFQAAERWENWTAAAPWVENVPGSLIT